MHRFPLVLTILTVLAISAILTVSPAFAQDATAPLDGATSPAGRRQEKQQRIENREQKLEERKAQIQAKRTEKQQQIVVRMKEKLAAVIDRLNKVASKLRDYVTKIRAKAAELATNRGADISAVESALAEVEHHIGSAETEITNVNAKLSELDETDKPKDVAQTFRIGVQSVHSHFKDARTNLVAGLKALRDAAKAMPAGRQESRPTGAAEGE